MLLVNYRVAALSSLLWESVHRSLIGLHRFIAYISQVYHVYPSRFKTPLMNKRRKRFHCPTAIQLQVSYSQVFLSNEQLAVAIISSPGQVSLEGVTVSVTCVYYVPRTPLLTGSPSNCPSQIVEITGLATGGNTDVSCSRVLLSFCFFVILEQSSFHFFPLPTQQKP